MNFATESLEIQDSLIDDIIREIAELEVELAKAQKTRMELSAVEAKGKSALSQIATTFEAIADLENGADTDIKEAFIAAIQQLINPPALPPAKDPDPDEKPTVPDSAPPTIPDPAADSNLTLGNDATPEPAPLDPGHYSYTTVGLAKLDWQQLRKLATQQGIAVRGLKRPEIEDLILKKATS
ncbi:MAG TPA: hypothetical protein V6D27_00870 [Vampirovibrionales bacterium]